MNIVEPEEDVVLDVTDDARSERTMASAKNVEDIVVNSMLLDAERERAVMERWRATTTYRIGKCFEKEIVDLSRAVHLHGELN